MLSFGANCAFSYDYSKVTDDHRIIAALKVFETTDSKDALERVFAKDSKGRYTKILFYDLGMVCFEYKKHFAAYCTDDFGDSVILIHSKYRNSPKEALAAVIAHESTHKIEAQMATKNPSKTALKTNLSEEIEATLNEVRQWNKSLVNKPELRESNDDTLIQRLNNLAMIYNHSGDRAISENIVNNSFYKEQLKL